LITLADHCQLDLFPKAFGMFPLGYFSIVANARIRWLLFVSEKEKKKIVAFNSDAEWLCGQV